MAYTKRAVRSDSQVLVFWFEYRHFHYFFRFSFYDDFLFKITRKKKRKLRCRYLYKGHSQNHLFGFNRILFTRHGGQIHELLYFYVYIFNVRRIKLVYTYFS